jgi:hypothetical protein
LSHGKSAYVRDPPASAVTCRHGCPLVPNPDVAGSSPMPASRGAHRHGSWAQTGSVVTIWSRTGHKRPSSGGMAEVHRHSITAFVRTSWQEAAWAVTAGIGLRSKRPEVRVLSGVPTNLGSALAMGISPTLSAFLSPLPWLWPVPLGHRPAPPSCAAANAGCGIRRRSVIDSERRGSITLISAAGHDSRASRTHCRRSSANSAAPSQSSPARDGRLTGRRRSRSGSSQPGRAIAGESR